MSSPSKRIVLATIGSLGDLHPCLALALGLRERGHQPVIASTELYRDKVQGLGLEFHPLRPSIGAEDPRVIQNLMDMRSGPAFLIRDLVLSALKETYKDLEAVAGGADLIIAGEIVFAAPLVAEKLGIPWVSALLSPFSFYSAYDPPVSPYAPSLSARFRGGPRRNKALIELSRIALQHWWKPVRQLRREVGLGPGRDPLFHDKFASSMTLALFSPELARPQRDWPTNTVQAGFVFYDQGGYDQDEMQSGLSPELSAFLNGGEAPIVFTLGSTAVHDPRSFFEESAKAADALQRRAVFLVGKNAAFASRSNSSIAVAYAPFSLLFPRAAAVVHQGGVGTTAQTLRAGPPALIMPCGFDQPDNAARVKRIGAGLTISRGSYNARNAARLLDKLLRDPSYAARAKEIAERLRSEDGVGGACDAIERVLFP
jgi:rhamnosyltransferase subunit B